MRKLSVILPVYNAEKTLAETLACVYRQTFLERYPGDLEVILVNDASTDGSLALLRREMADHPDLLHVIDLPENRGPGGARNAGLEAVSGEYIGFLDSDDTIDPAMYEKLYQAATAGDGCDIAECGIIDDNQDGAILYYTSGELTGRLTGEGKSILLSDVGYLWNRIYRSSLILDHKIRFRERMVMEDLDFLSEVFANAESTALVPEALYRYHNLPDSASKKDAEVLFFENTIAAIRAVYERLSGRPDYESYQAGAEYTYCRLAAAVFQTIDGYEELQAVTPDFAEKLRVILRQELKSKLRLSIEENPITMAKMPDEDRALLKREL